MLGLWQAAPRTQLSCAYWKSPVPGTPFISSTYVHFNAFWFQKECASIISSASLIFVRHLFSHLSNPTTLSAQEVGGSPTGAHGCASLSLNWIVSQEALSKLTVSEMRNIASWNFLLWNWAGKGMLPKGFGVYGFGNGTGLSGPQLDPLKKQNVFICLLGRSLQLN